MKGPWNLYLNNKRVTKLIIPDGVTSLGYAFFNCSSLTSIEIPDSVTSIGYGAFYNCSGLTSIAFEDTSTWYRTTSSFETDGIETDVSNFEDNATYFKDTYADYYWYKL